MGRYPFTECVNAYIPVERGHISEETLKTTRRRLMQLGRIFHQLKQDGIVSTDNPRKITPKDIDMFVGYRKMCEIKDTTILKDLGYLSKMLAYYDNEAVVKFKAKYPAHVPKKYNVLQDPIEEPVVQKILDRSTEILSSDWTMIQAYGLVTLAICTGVRTQELQHMLLNDVHVNGDTAEIFASHVKGRKKYGKSRPIAVHPDGVPMLRRYLEARRIQLEKKGQTKDSLFPPIRYNHTFLSDKSIRKIKAKVEEDIEEKFELRKCRRTYGQRALNEGQDIHNVSIMLGHATIATTQRYYCDKSQRAALDEMKEHWSKNRKGRASKE